MFYAEVTNSGHSSPVQAELFIPPSLLPASLDNPMPVLKLLENVSFDPEQIKTITSAYDKALHRLRLRDADLPTEALAKQIIAVAQDGELDTDRLCELALLELGAA